MIIIIIIRNNGIPVFDRDFFLSEKTREGAAEIPEQSEGYERGRTRDEVRAKF